MVMINNYNKNEIYNIYINNKTFTSNYNKMKAN